MGTLTVAAIAVAGAKVVVGGVICGFTLAIGFWVAKKLTSRIDEWLFLHDKGKHTELGIQLT